MANDLRTPGLLSAKEDHLVRKGASLNMYSSYSWIFRLLVSRQAKLLSGFKFKQGFSAVQEAFMNMTFNIPPLPAYYMKYTFPDPGTLQSLHL